MTWLLWLAAPAATTAVAAIVSWLRGRPPREPAAWDAMRAHDDYLHTLGAVTGARAGRLLAADGPATSAQ